MAQFDVFNGDADGICSLLQLRFHTPLESQLVTGVKRNINLLESIEVNSDDKVTVLDVSLDKNRSALNRILEAGTDVFYVDHHFAGDIPDSDNLTAIINTTPDVCTSILINQHLNSAYPEWAIVGAFGDNLKKSARVLASKLNLSEIDIEQLENLGIYINYNGYGASLDDLHFSPSELYQKLYKFPNPLDFINDSESDFKALEKGYLTDMSLANAREAEFKSDNTAVFILPNEKWARRVSGVYGNALANQTTSRAHAVLTEKSNGNYLVSIRAPLENKTGADEFCRQFPTGGGRAAAAGINDLPGNDLVDFISRFENFYKKV